MRNLHQTHRSIARSVCYQPILSWCIVGILAGKDWCGCTKAAERRPSTVHIPNMCTERIRLCVSLNTMLRQAAETLYYKHTIHFFCQGLTPFRPTKHASMFTMSQPLPASKQSKSSTIQYLSHLTMLESQVAVAFGGLRPNSYIVC